MPAPQRENISCPAHDPSGHRPGSASGAPVLLSANRTVPRAGQLLGMSRATVRFSIRRFNVHGPRVVEMSRHVADPRKLGPQVLRATLLTMLQTTTACRLSGRLLTWRFGVAWAPAGHMVQRQSCGRTLHGLGLRSGSPRLAMPLKVDPPESARKQWSSPKKQWSGRPCSGNPAVGVESRVQLLPLIRAQHVVLVGQQLRIPTPGTNVTRALFRRAEYCARTVVHRSASASSSDFLASSRVFADGLSQSAYPARRG